VSSDESRDGSEINRAKTELSSGDPNLIESGLRRLRDPKTDPETIGAALPTALPLLSDENAYYQQRAASTLEELAEKRPELIEPHIPELVHRFEEDADHAAGIVAVLAQVIDRERYDLHA
jgi:hypothetical protein